MRPIDADALIEGRIENDPVAIHAKCAPTIDPVKHGKWLVHNDHFVCSECKGIEIWKSEYCRCCGTKMDLK